MNSQEFLHEIIEPNVAAFVAAPTSRRHAWNAVVALLQIVDYLARDRGTSPKQEESALTQRFPKFEIIKDAGNASKHAFRGNGARKGLSLHDFRIGAAAPFTDGTYWEDETSFSTDEAVVRIEFNGEVIDLSHLCDECLAFLLVDVPKEAPQGWVGPDDSSV